MTVSVGTALAFLPLLLACVGPARAQPQPLVFAPRVVDNLSLLYARFSPDEFVVCLIAKAAGPHLLVYDFAMPPQRTIVLSGVQNGIPQRALKVEPDACARYDAVGELHGHPPTNGDNNCYLGPPDLWTFTHSEHPYIAVICARGLFYWHKDQVVPGNVAYPVDGQFISRSERW